MVATVIMKSLFYSEFLLCISNSSETKIYSIWELSWFMFALLELERDGTEQYNRNNNTTDLKNKDCRFRRVADLVVFGWVVCFSRAATTSLTSIYFIGCSAGGSGSSVFCNKTRLTQSPHPLSQLP